MTSPLRKAVDWTVGLMLIGVGVIGGFLPVVQGWVFILAGLAVLSSHSTVASRMYERLKSLGRGVRDRWARRGSGGPAPGS
jgi:uncharacterized membrane protein YbaN (DUF454 family)